MLGLAVIEAALRGKSPVCLVVNMYGLKPVPFNRPTKQQPGS
jgi:hypothetical protein